MQGNLPKGWVWKKLGDVANFVNGRAFKPSDWGNSGYPIIRIQNLTSIDSKFNYYGSEPETKYFIIKGDVLVSWSATLGAFIWSGEKSVLNQHIFKVVENHKFVNKLYLYYVIQTKIAEMKTRVHGSTMTHITKKDFDRIEIPVPPLPVQKRIVAILERAERLKEKRQQANEDTNTIIQSIFSDMFGDPQTNEKDWKMTTLLDVSAEKPQYGSGAKAVNFDNKLRYIRITDVDGKGDLRKDSVASPSEFEEKYLLKKGDLLFARSGATVGKTYLHQEEKDNSIYAGYMIRFRFNLEICNPGFIFALTRTKYYQNWLLGNQTQVAQPNINAQQYGGLKIFLPPIALQNKFASIVEKIESLKEKQKETTSDIGNLFDALMQAAFKGELAG